MKVEGIGGCLKHGMGFIVLTILFVFHKSIQYLFVNDNDNLSGNNIESESEVEVIGGCLNHGMGFIVLTILFVFHKLWSPCLPQTCMLATHQYLFSVCLFAYSFLFEMLNF